MTLQHPTDTLDIQALFPDGTQLIGGEWVPARTRETISVINPATGDTLANVPRGGPEDVDDAVGAASDAFPAWRDSEPEPPRAAAARLGFFVSGARRRDRPAGADGGGAAEMGTTRRGRRWRGS